MTVPPGQNDYKATTKGRLYRLGSAFGTAGANFVGMWAILALLDRTTVSVSFLGEAGGLAFLLGFALHLAAK